MAPPPPKTHPFWGNTRKNEARSVHVQKFWILSCDHLRKNLLCPMGLPRISVRPGIKLRRFASTAKSLPQNTPGFGREQQDGAGNGAEAGREGGLWMVEKTNGSGPVWGQSATPSPSRPPPLPCARPPSERWVTHGVVSLMCRTNMSGFRWWLACSAKKEKVPKIDVYTSCSVANGYL